MSNAPLNSAQAGLEIAIKSPIENVWRCLVEDIHEWWPKDFYVTESPKFILEPRIGGHLYEDTGDNTGAIWFKITRFSPPTTLGLEGHIAPPWGGPCMSLITISLEKADAQTKFKLADHLFGVLQTTAPDSLNEGWKIIFADHFKTYAEKHR